MNRNERLFELIKLWKYLTKGDSIEETNFNVSQFYKRGKINIHIAELIMLSVAYEKPLDEIFPNITDEHWDDLHKWMDKHLEASSHIPRDGLSIILQSNPNKGNNGWYELC